ncbi:MAG: S24/S26 family peptidase [Bacteroidales bacterium]|nr:S24/S26 family peptidase [Bacteroidales bacterium]
MTDEEILREAARLVADGVDVTLPVKGRSMLPFIIGGKESVILHKAGELKPGQVVLAEVGPARFVLHRIISVEPDGGKVVLMGDGNIRGTESCLPDKVLARATHVVDAQGNKRSLESRQHMNRAQFWYRLLPLRRYILWIMRKTIKKYDI